MKKRFVSVVFAGISLAAHAANPFLPGWEYIPDGEPYVFGDRVYLYGSHDNAGGDAFCDYQLRVWSAPLDDLNNWQDHGIIFSTRTVEGHTDDIDWSDNQFYAPDVAEKDGKYYLFAQIVGAPCAVAVSDDPAGPFKLISQIKSPAGAPQDFAGWKQYFDPGVLVDDDGKVYIYWGFGQSAMAQLNPKNMTEILQGTYQENIIPKENPFHFFEACSPRKINGTYYLIFAGGSNLAYATSKSPTGPFKWGGTIVRNEGDNPGGNIHGSLANLNGQWYIFYHRQTHNNNFSRRACAERVTIKKNGSIPEVEQTSLGFQDSLDPYKRTDADITCVLRGGNSVTEIDRGTRPVIDNRNGCVIGFKYFDFGKPRPGQKTVFAVDLRDGECAGNMEVWIGDPAKKGKKLGTVEIAKTNGEGQPWRRITLPVPNVGGRQAVYFKFADGEDGKVIAEILSFEFIRSATSK